LTDNMEILVNGRFLTQHPTGVQRYAAGILDAMDRILEERRDISVRVLSPRLSGARPGWRNIVHVEGGNFQGNLWEQLDLPRLSRGKMLFCPGNSSPILSLLRQQSLVVTIHDLSYSYFPDAYSRSFRIWYNVIIPLAMRNAAAILTVSEAERRSIIDHFPAVAPRIHAVANGGWPDGQATPKNADVNRRSDQILYVGSLSKRKNFPVMFEAAVQLSRKRGFRFCFVGGTAATLTASNLTLPGDVAGKIEFLGQIDDLDQLGACYQEAACFMFPSRYESSGLPPAEAMAWGCPVIASDIPALRERCGDAALYCDPDDPTSIVTAIESMMDDVELRNEYRARGYRRASEISWDRCARETLDVICRTAQAESRSN
jgi:glycosyltransferase involved in cell wall biosynthesis